MKLAIVVGSLREQSYNKKLAVNIAEKLPEGSSVEWVDANVPLFSEDLEPDRVPDSVRRAVEQVSASDAVLFVSPEYNRSFSGVTKNLIDWLSRASVGYPLDKKPGAVAGASPSPIGTAVMQSHLRPVLAHLGMDILALPEMFFSVPARMSDSGELNEKSSKQVEKFVAALDAHIHRR